MPISTAGAAIRKHFGIFDLIQIAERHRCLSKPKQMLQIFSRGICLWRMRLERCELLLNLRRIIRREPALRHRAACGSYKVKWLA